MYNVGIRKPGTFTFKVICKTWSRAYALRVALKWRRRGYDTIVEEEQQEES